MIMLRGSGVCRPRGRPGSWRRAPTSPRTVGLSEDGADAQAQRTKGRDKHRQMVLVPHAPRSAGGEWGWGLHMALGEAWEAAPPPRSCSSDGKLRPRGTVVFNREWEGRDVLRDPGLFRRWAVRNPSQYCPPPARFILRTRNVQPGSGATG